MGAVAAGAICVLLASSSSSVSSFQCEFELRDLRIELFGGSPEAHALQAQQLDPELLDQYIALEQLLERRVELFFFSRNLRVLLDQQLLERIDIFGKGGGVLHR
jgi:hypothetical protein